MFSHKPFLQQLLLSADLQSLGRVSQTCKVINRHATNEEFVVEYLRRHWEQLKHQIHYKQAEFVFAHDSWNKGALLRDDRLFCLWFSLMQSNGWARCIQYRKHDIMALGIANQHMLRLENPFAYTEQIQWLKLMCLIYRNWKAYLMICKVIYTDNTTMHIVKEMSILSFSATATVLLPIFVVFSWPILKAFLHIFTSPVIIQRVS